MVMGGPASGSQAPAPVLCMLWRTFVPCMVMGALRQVLPRALGPLCSPARPGTRVHTLQPALCLPSHASKPTFSRPLAPACASRLRRRHLLPFAAHVPVQLLSLWVGTATLGLLGSQAGPCRSALPMPAGLAGQVLLGFALPTLLVYLHEREERRLFWGQWDGAAGGAHEHQE